MRTTPGAVGAICAEGDATPPAAQIAPFIETANSLVTELVGALITDSARLELIERWLSAHFFSVMNPKANQEKAGSVGETLAVTTGMHLNETTYGQQVLLLDTTGRFSALQRIAATGIKRPKAAIYYVGALPSTLQPGYSNGGAFGLYGGGTGG